MKKNSAILLTGLVIGILAILSIGGSHDPWDGTVWDITSPDVNQPIGNAYLELQDLRKGTAIRANREHTTYASSSAGGVHKNGSAIAYYDVNTPSLRPDGTTALADNAYDKGRLWLDDNYTLPVLKRWTGAAWESIGIITAQIADANITTTKIADANITTAKIADDAITAAKIADSNITTALLASEAVTTAKIADSNVTLAKIDFFIDEANMASDSAVKVPSQQSVKSYVDTQVATHGYFTSGATVFNTTLTAANTWQDLDLSAIVGVNAAKCDFEVTNGSGGIFFCIKPKGYGSDTLARHYLTADGMGIGNVQLTTASVAYMSIPTDASGVIRIGATSNAVTVTIKLIGYVK